MKKLVLSEIWIYPIKSLGGIRLKSAKVLMKGFPYDRRWMLLDEGGKFMTQRFYPKMALFKMKFGPDESLIVNYQEHALVLPLHPLIQTPSFETKIWDDSVVVHEAGKEYNEWFSKHLDMKCTLVYFPDENPRAVDSRYSVNQEHVGLADAYPFLILGEQSLADLNERLTEPVPMNRFRPNLVFAGGDAYEEESWRNFRIGSNRFVGVKPCARCVLITVNQDTAVKGTEPLVTLATYRRQESKVLFGQNLVAVDHGEIYEGDEIILE
jgi:uncharacterized protein